MKDPELTLGQAREIRRLLKHLGEVPHYDLVKELGIVDPEEYIKSLKKRININLDKRPEWIDPCI